jgi:hypothetical protein
MRIQAKLTSIAALAALMVAGSCDRAPSGGSGDARLQELEARFTPGLHSLMIDLGIRHALTWFAGDARNWPLADYMVHELEELTEDIEELHPVYREIQVAMLLREMTTPAVEALESSVEARDHTAFVAAFDRLTAACNHCHVASGRQAIVVQRPTVSPLTNLRFEP